MEACGINFFYLRAVFPLTLMLATASAQVCVPLGHSSLYFINAIIVQSWDRFLFLCRVFMVLPEFR